MLYFLKLSHSFWMFCFFHSFSSLHFSLQSVCWPIFKLTASFFGCMEFLMSPWKGLLQCSWFLAFPLDCFLQFPSVYIILLKACTSDWDLNPHAGTRIQTGTWTHVARTRTQPKPRLGLEPTRLGLKPSQNPQSSNWDHTPGFRT